MDSQQPANSTRQRILECAAKLFAAKGYTETSMRELASAVGMKGASLYNHFPSKSAILEFMLNDYATQNVGHNDDVAMRAILSENPNAVGILMCLNLAFADDKMDYYQSVLSVIFQEQHRNPVIRGYISENIVQRERYLGEAIEILVQNGVLRQDIDSDFWMKCGSSIVYTFASRSLLGIGDSSPGYVGKSMVEMLYSLFDNMFSICGQQPT